MASISESWLRWHCPAYVPNAAPLSLKQDLALWASVCALNISIMLCVHWKTAGATRSWLLSMNRLLPKALAACQVLACSTPPPAILRLLTDPNPLKMAVATTIKVFIYWVGFSLKNLAQMLEAKLPRRPKFMLTHQFRSRMCTCQSFLTLLTHLCNHHFSTLQFLHVQFAACLVCEAL